MFNNCYVFNGSFIAKWFSLWFNIMIILIKNYYNLKFVITVDIIKSKEKK